MKFNLNFKWVALCAVLSAMLVAPALGQSKDEMAKFKEQRATMVKELKLAPDKEKAVLAVGDKYAAEREGLIANVKKDREALGAALKAATPDEAKVKELVSAIYAGMDKMQASFKSQRDEEIALMSPVEQGKYLAAMMSWREKMAKKAFKPGPEAPKK
jgi:Spy/CpxP family protein refolding chaperone